MDNTYRLNAVSSSRDAHSIFHARLKGKVVELALLGKVRDAIVRSNEQSFHFELAKPFVVDFGLILPENFHT